MIPYLVFVIVVAGVFGLLWWLLVTTEGVYLGRRVVIWLYDLYAGRYDKIKEFEPAYEHILLAQPILGYIAPHQSPLVLDVATGTGRLPDALLDHTHFHGRIIGVDLSRRMLEKAAEKLSTDGERVTLVWAPAEKLPFDDDTFDVVTCLESLEFMGNPIDVLGEIARVLRPGGLLLITNRINAAYMPGKVFTDEQLTKTLHDCDITDVEIEPWQEDYKRVWGMKDGDVLPIGARPSIEVLRCPKCGGCFVMEHDHLWHCERNHHPLNIGQDGIVDLFPLY